MDFALAAAYSFPMPAWGLFVIWILASPFILAWGWIKYLNLPTRSDWRSIASAFALASPILSGVVWLLLLVIARASNSLSDTPTAYWFIKVGVWIALGGMIVGLAGRPRLIPFIIPACIGTVLFWFGTTLP